MGVGGGDYRVMNDNHRLSEFDFLGQVLVYLMRDFYFNITSLISGNL